MQRILCAALIGIMLGLGCGSFLIYLNFSSANISDIFLLISFVLLSGLLAMAFYASRKMMHLHDEQYQAEYNLQNEKNRFDTIFSYTNTGIAFLNLDGSISKVNHPLCELLGYTEMELLTKNFYDLLHPNELTEVQNNVQQLLQRRVKTYQSEQQCFCKNGETIWMLLILSLVCDATNKSLYFVLQAQNISLQKKAEERLRLMAYHDALTGLANRNKLEQFINHMLAFSARHKQGFALLFLDLDCFKNINDTIGHEAGDLLLQVVAERLRSAVRATDIVARLGGDEFVLLITDVKNTEAIAVIAQKVLENVLKVITINGQEIYITTSIGISFYPYDGQNMQTLMKNADLALYRAKDHGRNNYQFYTMEMTVRAQDKLALQNALAHALVKNEFLLHYQPKMDVKTQRICGVEALLRWKNTDYATIMPNEIIALAEETGLIIPVSEWILKTACQQLKEWHDMGFTQLTMAVNCTARQFKQSTFIDELLKTILQIGLPPQALEMEVTEATIMQDPENTLRVLYALKDAGIQIAIDDFGTGYWSLSNLRHLSVDKIKVDKTFVKQAMHDETSAAIISAIIAMVNKLGITCIAEGVETREQYEFLIKEGCTQVQGYYLTKPLSAEAMSEFLKNPLPAAAIFEEEIS